MLTDDRRTMRELRTSAAMTGEVQETLGSLLKVLTPDLSGIWYRAPPSLPIELTPSSWRIASLLPSLAMPDLPKVLTSALSDMLAPTLSNVLSALIFPGLEMPHIQEITQTLADGLRFGKPEDYERILCAMAARSCDKADASEVEYFTTEVMGLPRELHYPVAEVIRRGAWKGSDAPLAYIHRHIISNSPGRPPGSGQLWDVEELVARICEGIKYCRKAGVRPSQKQVAGYIDLHSPMSTRQLERLLKWLREEKGISWKALLSSCG